MTNKIALFKNLLTISYFCFVLINIFVVNILSAHAQGCGPSVGIFCNPFTAGPSGITITTLSEAVIVITLYLLSLIELVSLLFIVFAGIKYMSSAGNEEQIKSAKNTFSSAVFGLIVALLAYGILSVINSILNG